MRKFFRILLVAVISLLIAASVLFAVLQSKWAKAQIQDKIASYLKQAGIEAKIINLNGRLPFSWTVQEADMRFKEGNALTLKGVEFRIAILPLLKGRMVVDYLSAEKASYVCSSSTTTLDKAWLQQELKTATLPFPIEIHQFKVPHVEIVNCPVAVTVTFGVRGTVNAHPQFEDFFLGLTVFSDDERETYLEAFLDGNKEADFVETKVKLHLDSKIESEFSLEGPWKTWEAVLYDLPRTENPLNGQWKGILSLDRKWKFKAEFSILSGQEAYVEKFLAASDLIHLKGKGVVNSELEKSNVLVAFSAPDVSLFSSFFPMPIGGAAHGKVLYRQGAYKASIIAEQLEVDDYSLTALHGLIKGFHKGDAWDGYATLTSKDPSLPFISTFAFDYVPNKIVSIADLELAVFQSTVKGSLFYDIPAHLYTGSLKAHAEGLDQFSAYFQENTLAGNLDAEFTLFPQEGEQTIKGSLAAKGVNYRDYFFESVSAQGEFQSFLLGKCDFTASKVYIPGFYFDTLAFSTHSDVTQWPFSLKTEGRMEKEFRLAVQGFWQKENTLFTLELTEASGALTEIPFQMKYPCTLEWGADYLTTSQLDVKIGQGEWYSRFEFSPVRSLGTWKLSHFPIEILRGLHPNFRWSGFISSEGYFDATLDNIEGNCTALLDENQAKGTLQAHLDQKRLQVHTDIRAIHQQFLDFTASLPLDYKLYPFQLIPDETKPANAELIAEGNLQDLFNFVNLGPNHFTGLVSCRLYLSNTLAAPNLLGDLELQHATYDNYFTGISLRNIDARFDAHGDTLQCISLQGNDEKKGEFTGAGKILFQPKQHFPYTFEAELKDLHAVGFDMIDAHLSGPAYFIGTTKEMLLQGNLLIDEAKIEITEHLPREVPSLPVTYVHFPTHLRSRATTPRHPFLFQIDLELTTEGTVLVKGAGLNAEVEGNVHLQGSDMNIGASGAMQLVKGDYQFAGKVFKLTEGEIVFNDKPAPSAYLNLNGTLDMPQATITAMLRGPLLSPQLTFQSNPQKSTSAILALILFNKDIAEISHPEAIQLASTLLSLSGGAGPDVLESIRKSLGVDRLNISTKPGSDELAVQIGKYLTKGVLITLSQSATSSNVIVEVELPKGFVFQAETQEEEEGKFSLKWTKSY